MVRDIVRDQFFHHVRGPAALPYDSVVYRASGRLLPDDRGLALIGYADSSDILRSRAKLSHSLRSNSDLGRPDIHRVVLDPARMGIDLFKFDVVGRRHAPLFVKHHSPRAGGSLIQRDDVLHVLPSHTLP